MNGENLFKVAAQKRKLILHVRVQVTTVFPVTNFSKTQSRLWGCGGEGLGEEVGFQAGFEYGEWGRGFKSRGGACEKALLSKRFDDCVVVRVEEVRRGVDSLKL